MLELAGDLDLLTETELRAALSAPLRELPPPDLLVVDLEATMFCGVRGMAVLAEAAEQAAELGIALVLACCTPPVRRLVELLDLGRRLTVVPTREQALRTAAPAARDD